MSRENRGLLINFGILLIVSLGFLLGYNVFYKAEDQKKYQAYFSESTGYKTVSVDSTILSEKDEILKGKEVIGYHYIGGDFATGIPGTEGKQEFRLSVIVDKDGKVINIDIDYSEHTESFVEKVLPFLTSLNDTNIINFLNVDDVGGASAYTMPVVHKVLSAITKDVLNKDPNPMIPSDPYVLVFGPYDHKEIDDSFVADAVVIKKEFIFNKLNQVIGVAYVGTGVEDNIPYHDGPAVLELLVGFDLDGNILGTNMLVLEHTSSYVAKMDAQIAALVGTNIDDLSFDIVAGATLSSTVVKAIIEGIKAKYVAFDVYSHVGPSFTTIENDSTFTATEVLLEKKILKDASNNIVGYVYVGTDGITGIPGHDGKEFIKLAVGTDQNNVITGVYFIESNHTLSFVSKIVPYLNNLVGAKLDEYQTVDVVAGASDYTMPVLTNILNAMKANVGGVEPEPVDPYTLVFGEYHHKAVDTSFVPNSVLSQKEFIYNNLNQVVGIAYVGSGMTTANVPGHTTLSNLVFLVGLGLDNKIVGTHILEHEHTPKYVAKLDPYFVSLVGQSIDTFETVDLVAGASTYTMPVIQTILSSVKTNHEAFDVYSYVGNEFVTISDDAAFTATEVLLEKKVLKDASDNVVGYVLVGTDGITGIPGHANKEYVKLAVGIDELGVITGVYLVESNHTPRYVAKMVSYFDDLVGININSFETVDLVAGASTFTMPVITNILTAMKGVA